MGFDLGGLLQQYLGGGTAPGADAADHFHQVAQNAPAEAVSAGLAAAFRSDQTPPFGQMVAQLFSQASPQQQAGMLNQLLGSLSPAALAALSGSGALADLTGQGGAAAASVSTQDVARAGATDRQPRRTT